MSRPPDPDKEQFSKSTVEIRKLDVVKELCANRGISFKEYLNKLIAQNMMSNGEYFSNRYFKDMAGQR